MAADNNLDLQVPIKNLYIFPKTSTKVRFKPLKSAFIGYTDSVNIWQDQWVLKKEIIASRIASLLQINHKLPGRVCNVKRIDVGISRTFLNTYHLQNATQSRNNYGLFLPKKNFRFGQNIDQNLEELLVAVMTFSNARKFTENGVSFPSYELHRFATLPHLNIIGGFSKLFNAFLKDKNWPHVMTYVDKDWSDGQKYQQLGFKINGKKDNVFFKVNPDLSRTPVNPLENWDCYNQGSIKLIYDAR